MSGLIDTRPHLTSQLEAATAAIGRCYRRPTGKTTYTICSAEIVAVKPWLQIVRCRCFVGDDGERDVPWTTLRRMVRIR